MFVSTFCINVLMLHKKLSTLLQLYKTTFNTLHNYIEIMTICSYNPYFQPLLLCVVISFHDIRK